ncbi:isobutyryl-CoA dehydrogenase, mitochondrial [Arthrobacter sp. Hiyo8]|nr:isobutyryl-CoA dehydrogenase, mitochondrial [Arthrobacter sp. Hiyo8]
MFELTEDQQAVVEMVRDFATTAIAPHAAEWDETKHFPVDVLREAGTLGMGGIYVREEFGGSGLSRTDAALIFEELSKADPTIAAYISIHNMVVWMIDAFGNDEQRAQWVPQLASMEALGSYCLTEPGAGSDAAALSTKAVLDGDSYVLNGTKQFISGAGVSSVYVVMARTADTGSQGITAIVVPADAPGLSFGPNEKKMGWNAQPTRQVIFEDVRVAVANRLGEEGSGFGIAMKGLNGGRVNMGACSLGGGQAALEKSIAYLKSRSAFGGPLINQQSLLFDIADMDTELETARTLILRPRTLWTVAPGHREVVRHGEARRHGRRFQRGEQSHPVARRLRLLVGIRPREDCQGPARPPDPGRQQRNHEAHRWTARRRA